MHSSSGGFQNYKLVSLALHQSGTMQYNGHISRAPECSTIVESTKESRAGEETKRQ
ncbi:MAG: hypothetical protein QXH39_04815 [Conexivisphaerales archaeon]